MLSIKLMGMQSTLLAFGRRFYKLKDRLKGVLLLGAVKLVAVNNGLGRLLGGPPAGPRPVHDIILSVRDAHQVTDLHLPQPQRHVAAIDVAADLDNSGRFANPAVADNAGSQLRPGQDLPEHGFHLFNVHDKRISSLGFCPKKGSAPPIPVFGEKTTRVGAMVYRIPRTPFSCPPGGKGPNSSQAVVPDGLFV